MFDSLHFFIDSGPSAVWIRSEMNQDVFGYGSDTSGALAILTYTNMYAAYKSTSDPITGSSGNHSVGGPLREPPYKFDFIATLI